jgi:hypothetical protein
VDSGERGWQEDPDHPHHLRYWNGHTWTAGANVSDGHSLTQLRLTGWRRVWYLKVARNPVVFYPLAWFGCSVPVTRGRLRGLMEPRETRELRAYLHR